MGQLSGVGVLDKSVAVLAAAARTPVGLSELVAATGLPRATAHRLAVALEAHRLLVRDPAGRWVPGPRLGELARSAPDPLVAAAGPVLTRLRDRSGESAQLYRRDGDERVCVAAAERTSGLRTAVAVGDRLPMSAGSGAQVLAAWSGDEELPAGARFGPRALAEVRRRGWAFSVAQREAGVASVSAPVRDRTGAVVAAISVSGPVERLTRRPGPRYAPLVTAAAAALGARL
ncbi:MAG TPA: IclR family transcriptional regulator [Mycobacteriales bacterium]|nr:IclR family transcriptional regulator [Mycobacteriales bacterium]